MKTRKIIGCLALILFTPLLLALEERHLIIIRHGECKNDITHEYNSNPKHKNYKPLSLTEKGEAEVKQTAEVLLKYGFDNRNIAAVYVSVLPRHVETAEIIARIGVFDKDKIKIEPRLIEIQAGDREGLIKDKFTEDPWLVDNIEAKRYHGESNEDVHKRVLAVYDEVEKKYAKGHIIFVTDGVPAMELIDEIGKNRVRLAPAQVYVMPLSYHGGKVS